MQGLEDLPQGLGDNAQGLGDIVQGLGDSVHARVAGLALGSSWKALWGLVGSALVRCGVKFLILGVFVDHFRLSTFGKHFL